MAEGAPPNLNSLQARLRRADLHPRAEAAVDWLNDFISRLQGT